MGSFVGFINRRRLTIPRNHNRFFPARWAYKSNKIYIKINKLIFCSTEKIDSISISACQLFDCQSPIANRTKRIKAQRQNRIGIESQSNQMTSERIFYSKTMRTMHTLPKSSPPGPLLLMRQLINKTHGGFQSNHLSLRHGTTRPHGRCQRENSLMTFNLDAFFMAVRSASVLDALGLSLTRHKTGSTRIENNSFAPPPHLPLQCHYSNIFHLIFYLMF